MTSLSENSQIPKHAELLITWKCHTKPFVAAQDDRKRLRAAGSLYPGGKCFLMRLLDWSLIKSMCSFVWDWFKTQTNRCLDQHLDCFLLNWADLIPSVACSQLQPGTSDKAPASMRPCYSWCNIYEWSFIHWLYTPWKWTLGFLFSAPGLAVCTAREKCDLYCSGIYSFIYNLLLRQ